jgi:hypothetical protein
VLVSVSHRFHRPDIAGARELVRAELRMRAGLWVNILGWGVIIAVSAVTLPWLA